MLLRARAGVVMLLLAPVLAMAGGAAVARAAQPTETLGPSGLPVPRYESLKYGALNGRQGPSLDHRILWRYHRRGLPVEIIAESDLWRQVADPDGDVSWIQASGLAPRRTAYVSAAAGAVLRAGPQADARAVATLGHGVVGVLEECRGGWRRLEVSGRQGWIPAADLWGAEQCGAPS